MNTGQKGVEHTELSVRTKEALGREICLLAADRRPFDARRLLIQF